MKDRRSGQGSSILTRSRLKASELFPLLSRRRKPLQSAYVVPVLVSLVVGLVAFRSVDVQVVFVPAVVAFALAGLYFIQLLCGWVRPLWWTAAAFAAGAGITWLESALGLPFLDGFGHGRMPSFDTTFLHELSQTGLPEEFFKALPIVGAVVLGWLKLLPRPKLGINTPIHGALFGAAVGLGFNLVEMLFRAGDETGALQQVVLRLLGQPSLHAAWSGLVGYYIGLGVLTRRTGRLGCAGLLLAAVLHAGWDSAPSDGVLLFMGGLSYIAFAAAVLKGRQLLSRIEHVTEAPASEPSTSIPLSPGEMPVPRIDPSTPSIAVRLGSAPMQLRPGDTLRTTHVPTLVASRGDEVVAEVVENPSDRTQWGLRNLSLSAWRATVGPNEERLIEPGYTILLGQGVAIRLADVTLEVDGVMSGAGGRLWE